MKRANEKMANQNVFFFFDFERWSAQYKNSLRRWISTISSISCFCFLFLIRKWLSNVFSSWCIRVNRWNKRILKKKKKQEQEQEQTPCSCAIFFSRSIRFSTFALISRSLLLYIDRRNSDPGSLGSSPPSPLRYHTCFAFLSRERSGPFLPRRLASN